MNCPPVSDKDLAYEYGRTRRAEAFEALVRRHEAFVARLCRLSFKSPEDADDAAQETFARLLIALPRFKGTSSFTTFLFGICKNACRELKRRAFREHRREEKAYQYHAGDVAWREAILDPDIHRLEALEAERLLEALRSMREPERSLLYLKEAEEFSISDLAANFHMPEGTVKSKLSRARQKLMAFFEEGL